MKDHKNNKNLPYSKLAIASLVMGIVGILFGFKYLPLLIITIPALITGILALKNISKNKGMRGRILAWIGIIISSIQIVSVLMLLAIFYMISTCVNNSFSDVPVPYENAVKHMNKNDLIYYNSTLSKLNQNTSDRNVEEILGKPKKTDSYSEFILYNYDCPKSSIKHCSVFIIFKDHLTQSVLWFNDTKFWFARNFDESDNAYFNGVPNAPMEGYLDYILHILRPYSRVACFP